MPYLQKYVKYTKPEIADAPVTAVANKTVGKKKNQIPTNSVITISVMCGGARGIKEERTVIFETNIDLEHKGLLLPFIFSTFSRGACEIQVVNVSDDQFFYLPVHSYALFQMLLLIFQVISRL